MPVVREPRRAADHRVRGLQEQQPSGRRRHGGGAIRRRARASRRLRLRGALGAMATTASGPPTREQIMVRLRRAEGQLRGVQRMLDEGSPCDDVLVQLAAVTAALDQVGLHLIGERLRQCQQADGTMCAQELEQGLTTLLRHTRLAR